MKPQITRISRSLLAVAVLVCLADSALGAEYLGDFATSDTVRFLWDTRDTTGTAVNRSVDGTVAVYKDNGLTQSTDGVTDTEQFDGFVGLHACAIDLDNAFYAAASDYSVVVTSATVGGQVQNRVLAHFSIGNRRGIPDTTWDEAAAGHVGAGSTGLIMSKVGTPTDWGSGSTLADNLKDLADTSGGTTYNRNRDSLTELSGDLMTTHTTLAASVAAIDPPTSATIVAGVLAGVVDGSVDVQTALQRILAVNVNNAAVSGTTTKTLIYKDPTGVTTRVTHTVPTAGTGRTASF